MNYDGAPMQVLAERKGSAGQPALAAALDRLADSTRKVEALVDTVIGRLDPVRLHVPHPDNAELAAPRQPMSDVSGSLHARADQLDRVFARLSELLNELEV